MESRKLIKALFNNEREVIFLTLLLYTRKSLAIATNHDRMILIKLSHSRHVVVS